VLHIGANVGKITLAARYGPHLGEYMMHCHNGVHEDDDMFRAFMVRLRRTSGHLVVTTALAMHAVAICCGWGRSAGAVAPETLPALQPADCCCVPAADF
jgi:Multicopper oxidase